MYTCLYSIKYCFYLHFFSTIVHSAYATPNQHHSAESAYISDYFHSLIVMSGPPGVGILSRSPYNGTPNITGAPPKGIDGNLPSGTVQSSYRNDVIEPMANAVATFPFFIAPVTYANNIVENDILMIRTDREESGMSNVNSQYGILARPLRLLQLTPEHLADKNTLEPKLYTNKDEAIAEAKAWRCLGSVVAVGARSDRDRQVVNVAIRGRIAAPNIFKATKKVPNYDGAGNLDRITARGDQFAVTLSVVKQLDENDVSKGYIIRVGTAALQSATDVPRNDDGTELTIYHMLGTYIRQISNATAGDRSIKDYLQGDKSIRDRKGTFELALRL